MIHLDTNILIGIAGAVPSLLPYLETQISLEENFACSSLAWSEFSAGPTNTQQIYHIQLFIEDRILSFEKNQAELSAQLFNLAGRKRSSKLDCMIAATAISHQAPLATYNRQDFEKFIPHGLQLEPLPEH